MGISGRRRWLSAQLISRYRALAINVSSAISHRDARAAITVSAAYSPAEALLSRLSSALSHTFIPAFLHTIPSEKLTARYPSPTGTASRSPLRASARVSLLHGIDTVSSFVFACMTGCPILSGICPRVNAQGGKIATERGRKKAENMNMPRRMRIRRGGLKRCFYLAA